MASIDTQTAYDELLDRYQHVSHLKDASGLLGWDQRVTMPEDGTPARAAQLSALSSAHHDYLTNDAVTDLLTELDRETLSDEQSAVVREIRRQHERATSVPRDLVAELSLTQSEAQAVWEDAKASDDFEAFAPTLTRLRDLHRERAEHIDPDTPPFEVLFEGTEPHLPIETVERIFERLRDELVPLIEAVRESDVTLATPFSDTYDDDTQFDARVTTRFDETDPLGALGSTIHEFGHALYQLGLPKEQYGTPLGQPVSHGVHESQSRLWENHVGRTRAFWEFFLPTANEHLSGLDSVSANEIYEAANRIYPDNLIRVEADELTYHFHIVLRFEIERAFVAGDIGVDEIPQVWAEKMDEYLGVRPDSDTEGCLQDIHWASGFASFQNYTVGSVLAAQLDAAMRDEIDVDARVRAGEFAPLREWLTDNVHSHGHRYPTDELVRVATGESLTADYFIEYAREKFGALYGLDG